MWIVAAQIVGYLLGAAALGFVTAWVLRNALDRSKAEKLESDVAASTIHPVAKANANGVPEKYDATALTTALYEREQRIAAQEQQLVIAKQQLATAEQQLAALEQRHIALEQRHIALEQRLAVLTHAVAQPALAAEQYDDIPRFLETTDLPASTFTASPREDADPLSGQLFGDDAPTVKIERRDDLKRVRGIGPKFERALHALGVTTYQQIAQWSDNEVERYARELHTFADRLHRDDWRRQAREQHLVKYGERLEIH